MEKCISEKVDFILIAGDLFDTAYPSIEIIKEAFNELRKVKEANIPVFLIAGSHDYSASGKTFLDVIEKAGFAKNIFASEERNGKIVLLPTIYKNVALYGYPGRKSGLEVPDVERIELQDAPGFFKILMLHTTLRDAIGSLPIPAVDQSKLPKADYIALAHLHLKYERDNRIYCGPTFPNNSAELEDLQGGSFYIVNTESGKINRHEIKLKDVLVLDIEVLDALTGTDKVLEELKTHDLRDKILILKLKGLLERGKISDIDFHKLEEFAKNQGVYVFLKNTGKLSSQEQEIKIEIKSDDMEVDIIEEFQKSNPNKFNHFIPKLLSLLQIDKKEGETSRTFEDRLLAEFNKETNL